MARRILVVEDRDDIRDYVRYLLASAGFEVDVAGDGAEALQRAVANPPVAILLDLVMPGMHGYELLQQLRARPGTALVPAIVLSAKAYASDQRKALDMGAAAFVQKPFDGEALVALVKGLVDRTLVTFWGVRGSCAAPGPETARYGGNTPCVSIDYGVRKLGMYLLVAAGKPFEVDLLISHTHWDHIQGFPFFVPAYIPGNTIRVFGPRSAEKPLEKVLRTQMDVEYFPVALGDMAARIEVSEYRGEPFTVGPFHVRPKYLNHPGITLGYRIEASGMTIAYATDTEPFRTLLPSVPRAHRDSGEFGKGEDEGLLDLVRGADLYIADAQYSPDEHKKKTGWGHTCYLDAVDIALRAGVKKLVLFSHDPMHDDAAVDKKLEHSRQLADEKGGKLELVAASELVPVSVARLV
jgi:CheY-like chemotaxis protein